MPTNFPTSVDALTNPASTDSLNAPSHSSQHTNANDAIEAIETYLLDDAAKKQTFRNIFTNGSFSVSQRFGTGTQTFTAAAALAYSVDRWYGYCTGANITGARVTATAPDLFNYRFTGAVSNTAVGFGQRIESANSIYLAGQTATLSVSLASSSLTSITWTAYYANSTDSFGTLASPTRTLITSGTFTITSTLTRYSANISIPIAATTGIEIVFTSGALVAAQTLTFDSAQLELGNTATSFENLPVAIETLNCQRYYFRTAAESSNAIFASGAASSAVAVSFYLQTPVSLRALPTTGSTTDFSTLTSQTNFGVAQAVTAVSVNTGSTRNLVGIDATTTLQTANAFARLIGSTSGTSYLGISAEL